MNNLVRDGSKRDGVDPTRDLRGLSMVAGAGVVAIAVLPNLGPLCPMRRLTGVPCPLCGGTTSVFALIRGDVASAVAANPLALAAIAAVTAAWVLWGLARLEIVRLASEKWSAPPRVLVPALALSWIFQLHRYDVL